MSIEKSPASTANPKAAARSDSGHGVKSKAAGSGAAADGTGTGFMAILGALGDAPTDAPLPSAGTPDAALPDAGAAVPAFDASLMLQQNPQIAAAQAATAVAAAAAATASSSAASAAGLDASVAGVGGTGTGVAGKGAAGWGVAGLATGAASAALAQDPATLAQAATVSALAAAQGAARSLVQSGEGDGKAPAVPAQGREGAGAAGKAAAPTADLVSSAAGTTPDPATAPTQGLQHAAGAHARAVREAAATDGSATLATGNGTAPASTERAAADKFMAALEQGRAPQGERALEPLLAPLQPKQEKPQEERAGFSFKTAEPTYSGSTLGVSAPDFSQSGAPAPVMAPEMQVAEQVSYWVSQNVQNAELKLDGLGQTPVQVSISVQGNEAQISFHSDEAATRSMLEGAGAHLKDMLQREGLVLTGVSVGSSGSGEAGGGERRARQNARQGVIAPLQVAAVDGAARLRTDAGRAVDLFV